MAISTLAFGRSPPATRPAIVINAYDCAADIAVPRETHYFHRQLKLPASDVMAGGIVMALPRRGEAAVTPEAE